jgi:CBS domain-containing protein
MLVRDIMTLSPVVVAAGDPIALAAQYMVDWDVGIVPVVNDLKHKRLVGVITDRDIVVRCVAAGESRLCEVGDHMTPSPITTVYPEMEVHVAMDAMQRAKVRRLPIVDADEKVIGMLTLGDVARHVANTDPLAIARLLETISQPTPIPV